MCQSEKIIIEYDERQHFSEARKISLINYPEEIAVFYSLESWIESCEKIAAKDNHPANRDEIRAYYDSVRDIESYRNGYKLIRIRHGDFDWNRKDGDEYLKEILKFKPITSNTNNSVSSLKEYDWRSLEVELQRVRVQYLKWLYNFKPIPCDALDAIIYDNKVLVVDSPLGRSFSLSPAGAGSVYVGGGKGVQGLLKGSYQEDELLRKESSHIKQSLNQKVRELRKHIRMLLKMKRYADVWEHIQNFWWLRLGIHEFVFDMNFGPSPMPTNSVRNYVLAAIYNKIDLSSEVPNSFSDEEILHSLRYKFSWNRFANCSYDCGPIVVGKDRYIPYREAAQQVREYFQSNNSKVGELKNRNEKRDFAASSLAENHDFLLLYHKEPVGFITLDQFHEKKNVLRTHIENIEEKLQNIELQEGLNLG